MPDDYYQMLGILSPEAEEVQRVLSARQNPTDPTVYPSRYQPVVDYHREAEAAASERDNLAMQAEIQRRLTLPTMGGRAARGAAWKQAMEKAMYEKQATMLMEDLRALDPADPEALSFQDEVIAKHPIARKAMSDPRVASLIRRQSKEHEEMQELFDADPDSRLEYTKLRARGVDPSAVREQVRNSAKRRQDRLWFATNGGDPADFDSGKFNGPDGRPDKAKMAHFLSTRKTQEDSLLSSTERKFLDKAVEDFQAMSGVNPDDEEAKRIAFQAKFGREPESDADWAAAYKEVANSGLAQKEALAALILDFEQAGKRVPDIYKKMIGVAQPGAAPAAPTAQAPAAPQGPPKPVMVRTKADYDGLASGTRYLDSTGNIKIKK